MYSIVAYLFRSSLHINQKTKVMTMRSSCCNINIQGTTLEQVSSFPCISLVTPGHARCEI